MYHLTASSCILGMLFSFSTALRVTPGSPCASSCLDLESNGSSSSSTTITCHDSQYESSPAGRKFQTCMSCLQESEYAQGSETDQLWFLYNLRHTFDTCVFDSPSASSISSCSASSECGVLEAAFIENGSESGHPDYSYCDVDGGVITSSSLSKCQSCIRGSKDHGYLANYLVALEAGCSQRPSPGTKLGLNDTVFSMTRIKAVESASKAAPETQSDFSTTTIIGLAVGGVAIILAIAGFMFLCSRRRRNRRIQLESDRCQPSPLSFCCQTRLPPCSPTFSPTQPDSPIQEKAVFTTELPLRCQSAPSESQKSTSPTLRPQQLTTPSFSRPRLAVASLHAISTTVPAMPDNVHYSTSPKSAQFSPQDITPISVTSTTPFLNAGGLTEASSPVSDTRSERDPKWATASRETLIKAASFWGKKRGMSTTGNPVESVQINMTFPGPPSPRGLWGRT